MQSFTKNDYKSQIITSYKHEYMQGVEFNLYEQGSPFFDVLKSSFINKEFRLEEIPKIKVEQTSGYFWYQTPFNKRGYGTKRGSLIIKNVFFDLIDDENGNMHIDTVNEANQVYDELINDGYSVTLQDVENIQANFEYIKNQEDIVGNIFYNSGNIFLYKYVFGDVFNDFNANILDIEYLRKVEFLRESFYANLISNETTFSMNNTFMDSDAPIPYVTNIILFNDDNDAIMRARLSKPIKCKRDILFLIEHYES